MLHPKFPLGKSPLEQVSGNTVLTRLRELAAAMDITKHTEFCSEVETIRPSGNECAALDPTRHAPASMHMTCIADGRLLPAATSWSLGTRAQG